MFRLLTLLMVCSVFMDDFFFFRAPFDFYYYYLIYLLFIISVIVKNRSLNLLPSWFTWFMLVLYGISLAVSSTYDTLGFHLVKQFLGITYSAIAFYLLLKSNSFNIMKIFNIYLQVAFWVALWGLFVEFLMLNGIFISQKIKTTTTGFYRVYSIMGEPYFLAVALMPAMYYCLYRLINEASYRYNIRNLFQGGVIFVCFVLTFSSAGYMGLILMVVMYMYSANYFSIIEGRLKFLIMPVIIILFFTFYNNLKDAFYEFQVRVDDTLSMFQTKDGVVDVKKMSKVNSSTFALYTNYIIAKESFQRNPLFGSGLGSHPINYDITFAKYFPADFTERFGTFNKFDANSLFLRLMSETGLFGLTMLFLFLFRFFMGKKYIVNPHLREINIVNQGIFILIIVRLIRTGSYFGNGFFLFIFMYYYTNRIAKGKIRVPWLNYDGKKTADSPPASAEGLAGQPSPN
ncbi:MAG: O-antigen ligase family protein [Bacteroidetes bacterium]|nr:O-antigen ligase family protein [Bacteroidota bacterium]